MRSPRVEAECNGTWRWAEPTSRWTGGWYVADVELGVCLAADVGDIDYAVLAEELGYDDLWVADSQMLWSDCYATMALIGARTSRITSALGWPSPARVLWR